MSGDSGSRRPVTALITVVHGRHEHLQRQLEAVALCDHRPDHHVIVAMDDPTIAGLLPSGPDRPHLVTTDPPALSQGADGGGALPLARARNLGATTALALGAEVLVFLDVDCLPAPAAIGAYAAAATAEETSGRLLCGPVTYLPPAPDGGYRLDRLAESDRPHPARPAPAPGEIELGGAHELFWSLSFALHADVWRRIGGFAEEYVGYGGEDTDFAFTARARGVELAWVGSARAYHQHHAVSSPPVEHVADIVRNARVFHDRWGTWPMQGWLDAFEQRGLVTRDPAGAYRVS